MADVVSVGIISAYLNSIDKSIALALQEADHARPGFAITSDQLQQAIAELQNHCDQVRPFLEQDQEPLIIRVDNLAQRVWQILSDLLAIPGGGDVANSSVTSQRNSQTLHQPPTIDVDVAPLPATQAGSERQYGNTYLADNAQAHLGDVIHYHVNYYYGTASHFSQTATQYQRRIDDKTLPLVKKLQQEAKDCWQALSARIVMVMDSKGHQSTDSEDQPEARSKKVGDLANTMKHALWYPELFSRQERIVQAHNKTFQWAFEHVEEKYSGKWDCFLCWLKQGNGIYWVNGKAGSGKSTLINYFKNEDRTARALEEWGPLTDLVVGSFFFWNSGSVLERSLLGLYRSLIIQILDKAPRTVEIMFDQRTIAEAKNVTLSSSRDAYWTEQKLSSAFRRLASTPNRYETFCFFIDGLDEFDGDHDILVEILEEISSSKHIKVCCSSRPLAAFTEGFADCPNLRLQDLTANDIRAYVSDQLKHSKKGQKFAETNKSAFDSLVACVAKKADGVFLWVYLVTRSLQTGLRNGDNEDELNVRVDDSPQDLLDLFRKMISKLDPRYKAEGAGIFRIALSAPTTDGDDKDHSPAISILDLLLAADESVLTKAQAKFFSRTTWEKLAEQVQNFEQRVAVTCCGLLEFSQMSSGYQRDWLVKVKPEISPVIRVGPRLLHQSVSEFLKEQDTMTDFRIEPMFEDYERLLAGRVVVIRSILSPGMSSKVVHDLADYGFTMARHMEERTGRTNTVLVEEIYASCSTCVKLLSDRRTWLCADNSTSKKILNWIRELELSYGANQGSKALDVLDDFDLLAYAIAFGLYSYAYKKICDDPDIVQKRSNIPLLHVMMSMDPYYQDKSPQIRRTWLDLLRRLLEAGADPNLSYRGQTPWSVGLSMLAKETRWKSLGAIPEELYLFLEFGADVNVSLRYTGVIGPLARVEGYAACYNYSDSDDDLFLEATDKQLMIIDNVQQQDPSPQHSELHQLLRTTLEDRTKRVTLKAKDGTDDEFDFDEMLESNNEMILFMFGKVLAAQKESIQRVNDYGDSSGWTESDEAAIHVFPVWEISLLQWVNECLVQTKEVKAFGCMLEEKGACLSEPKVVFVFVQRGSIAGLKTKDEVMEALDDEDHSDFSAAVQALDTKQSAMVTAAWKKAFPNYITGGLSRELHRMLSLVDARSDALAPLGATGTVPLSMVSDGFQQLIADGKIPTTGLRICGVKLDPMTEACGRILGTLEILLKWGNQLDQIGGLAGLLELRGPEELQEDAFWGESQACSVM